MSSTHIGGGSDRSGGLTFCYHWRVRKGGILDQLFVCSECDAMPCKCSPRTSAAQSPVVAYVTEEVSRQGHDVGTRDGIQRVGWMLEAWTEALWRAEKGHTPTIAIAEMLGKMIEPERNEDGFRSCHVRVGMRQCPPPERVSSLLRTLFEQIDVLPPIEFYKGFEEVHPFRDGNGRTGKILLNWLNGTLLDPVFPPSDLFGHPIRNP